MYKPLADNTLMGMTKKEIIEQLRIAEHNYQAVKETVNQQAENFIKLLAEERKHGHWIEINPKKGKGFYRCSVCNGAVGLYDDGFYCQWCGATMDEVVKK